MSDLPHSRRAPVRIDAEDGPWSVSVAESPHDARAYSIYIKTPTHNLTLTRTASEMVELDAKLREGQPTASVPPLPLDAHTLPPKRKSSFLNTLSRLTSPNSSKTRRMTNSSASSVSTSLRLQTPEQPDPSQTFTPSAITATLTTSVVNPISTSLAAYLTTVSNTAALCQTRVWKRFVRVRTDDLESVRVERAIKRVRSDLAVHTAAMPAAEEVSGDSAAGKQDVAKEEEGKVEKPSEAEPAVGESKSVDSEPEPNPEAGVEAGTKPPADTSPPPTSSAEDSSQLTPPSDDMPDETVHRAHSADPDTASSSRALTSSSASPDGTSSQTEGDESSVFTSGRKPKKKRSMSVDPKLLKKSRKVVIDDFEMMRVLGKGCAGKVLLVRHKSSADLYALKAITKRHVLAHQELQHTLTEQAVLKRMAAESKDPFVVKLWWSFHDKENLFLVMDFHPGGDLATQLARWGRLGRDRARFYAAEIVEGLEGLHAAGVIYRDLKPENILIGGDGHIVLTDFGLSKEFPNRASSATAPSTPKGTRDGEVSQPPWMLEDASSGWPGQAAGQRDSTATFCGTAEYLAPEVIQGLAYSYEVDWWSFGTMLFEMLAGITPFWASTHSEMYVRVLQDELHFPDDRAIDQDTKSLLRGLLQRDPALRLSEPRVKRHPYFSMIDWSHVYYKRYIPPYIPPTDPSNKSDTQNFDETFLDMEPVLDEFDENEETDADDDQENAENTTDTGEEIPGPAQSRSPSVAGSPKPLVDDDSVDLFDGYSFKGRQSVLIEEEQDEEESSEDETSSGSERNVPDGDLEAEVSTPIAEVTPSSVPEARAPSPETEPIPGLPVELEAPQTPTMDKDVSLPTPTDNVPAEALAPASEPVPPTTEPPVTKPPPVPPKELKPPGRRPAKREKSGVPALDRYLSEDGAVTEFEDDDEDWDFIEAGDVNGEERNGAKATTLFARGVVDRYRLAVFSRKASSSALRSSPSPSPSPAAQRRGRSTLSFRPKTKSPPPSSFPSILSTQSSSTGDFLNVTPARSLTSRRSLASLGGMQRTRSLSGESGDRGVYSASESTQGTQSKVKRTKTRTKKMKKSAEKMLSLFSPSPRIPHAS